MPTPLEWLAILSKQLDHRAREIEELEDWYEGDHPIPSPPPNTAAGVDAEARLAFDAMQKLAVTNFLPPIVDAPASKLRIEGYRSSRAKVGSDADLWVIHRRNHLVTDARIAITEAVKVGQTAAVVWADAAGQATIEVEDPEHVIVAYEPGSRRRRAAALKRWEGDDEHLYATVYLPDGLYKYRSKGDATATARGEANNRPAAELWEPREVPNETWPLANPLGVVPMVEIRVNADLKAHRFGGGCSQFGKEIGDQKRINRTVFNRLITEEHQAFRQRWVTDWDVPLDADGRPDKAQILKSSAARMMIFNNDDPMGGSPKVGEFAQADFNPFLRAVQEDVKAMASKSATPPYAFLLGDMVNVAGDALARIEGAHLGVVSGLADELDDAFVEIMRLALRVEGDSRAGDPSLSVVWGEFEQRTATEQANLAQIAKGLGVPIEDVFAMLPGVDQAKAQDWARSVLASELRAAATPTAP